MSNSSVFLKIPSQNPITGFEQHELKGRVPKKIGKKYGLLPKQGRGSPVSGGSEKTILLFLKKGFFQYPSTPKTWFKYYLEYDNSYKSFG